MLKRFIPLVLGSVVLSVISFMAGRHFSPDHPRTDNAPHASPANLHAVATTGPAATKPTEASGIRPFVPGRPFPEGGARDWILSLTPALKGDKRGRGIAIVNCLPSIFTMDETSVREVVDALQSLTAEANAENPQRRNNPNGDGVLDALMEFALIRMAQTNPDAAMESLSENFNLNDGTAQLMVMGTIATHDAARAEKLALSLKDDHQKDALRCVLYALANQDPIAALAFADRHQNTMGDQREELFEGWVRRDPQAAMNAAIQSMTKSGDPEIFRNTLEEWTKTDPAAAAQWAAAHEGAGKVIARAQVLEKVAREDPQRALQEFAALHQAAIHPEELARLTSTLAGSLAAKDVPTARSWAESLPPGDLRDRALLQTAKEWAKIDAPATSEWILSLPTGPLRDGAAHSLASTISRRDPAAAFEWARSITNESLRQSALQAVLQQWREMDPDAATTALESLPTESRPPP